MLGEEALRREAGEGLLPGCDVGLVAIRVEGSLGSKVGV